MSFYFGLGDGIAWSPALRVGGLFETIAVRLARDHGLDHGFRYDASDTVEIDLSAFTAFVRALLDSSVTAHPEYRVLASGFLAVCCALLREAGVAFEPETPQQREIQDLTDRIGSLAYG